MTVTLTVLGVSYLTHVPQAQTNPHSHVDFLNLIIDVMRRENSLEKSIMLGIGGGTRKRGRPRHLAVNAVTNCTLTELCGSAKDRDAWRKTIIAITRSRTRLDGTHREVSLPPRHFGFRTSGAPSRWGGGSSERLQYTDSPFRELVNVLSWEHDGRLFIVSDTYVGNFQTTILAS